MSRQLVRWVAGFMLFTAVAIATAATYLYLQVEEAPADTLPGGNAVLAWVFVLWCGIGAVVARKASSNPVGWLLCFFPLVQLTSQLLEAGYWAGRWPAVNDSPFNAVFITCLAVMLLLFPDGRPASRLWRVVAWVIGASGTGLLISSLAVRELPVLSVDVFGLVIPIGLLSLVVRWIRSTGLERQQLRLVAWSAAPLIPILALFALAGPGSNSTVDLVTGIVFALAIASIPIAMGAAILRHRLFDIDRLLSRATSYLVVLVILGAVYVVGAVWLPSRLLDRQPPLFVAGSTLAVAALFNPVRKRVLGWVDRRFYRSRYSAERVVAEFSARLRDEIDLGRLTVDLTDVVTQTMQPSMVGVWVRER